MFLLFLFLSSGNEAAEADDGDSFAVQVSTNATEKDDFVPAWTRNM